MEPLLSGKDVAAHLGVPEGTLTQWRYHKKGPRYIVVGRHVRYRAVDVEAWEAEQAIEPAGASR